MLNQNLPHLDEYLLSLQSNGYSLRTVYCYERDLKVFGCFIEDCKTTFKEMDKRFIVRYKAYLSSTDRLTSSGNRPPRENALNSFSLNRMLSSLRSYLRYLIEMDYACPLSPDSIRLIRTPRKHANLAEMDELVRLIESPTLLESRPFIAARNRAILETLFATGMRISELRSLNRVQVDGSGRIFITGKGRKQRFVYLTPRAQTYIERYLALREDDCPALFIPTAGRNVGNSKRRLSTNYIQERIKRYREKLRINIPTSAHSFRHGYATYLAEQGANPAAIQVLLGHESLTTTTRYVQTSDRFAEETHKRYHPLANPDVKGGGLR
jgi:site-specific recombinase XerD